MITIEEINGEKYTVVWHGSPERTPEPRQWFEMPDGTFILLVLEFDGGANCYATALPALPRHPKPEDAPLLYRYMAEIIDITIKQTNNDPDCLDFVGLFSEGAEEWFITTDEYKVEITHAINSDTGERVEVAIKENEQ